MAWTVEDRLILACLKLLFKEREAVLHEIEALRRPGVDEDAFSHRLEREGVAGLVYFTLSQDWRAKKLFPDGMMTKLMKGYYYGASQNVRILHHLATVLRRLDTARIRTIVWKGAALVEEVYPSPGARDMCDVDLVVLEEEFARVKQILEGLGFSSPAPCPYLFFAPGLLLDIHTDIVNSSGSIKARSYAVRMEIEELWQRGISWREGYASIRLLSPCDSVLTLSAHLQRHSFSRLIWFVDIAQLMSHYGRKGLWSEREWGELLERAKVLNLTKCLYFTLHFLHDVLEFPMPGEVLQPSNFPRLNAIEQAMFRMLLDGRRFEPLGELLFFFSVAGFTDRCRFLRDLFSPRPESLPPMFNSPWLSGAGYLLRLGRVLRMVTTSIARSVKGGRWDEATGRGHWLV